MIPKGTRVVYAGTRQGFWVIARLPGEGWEVHRCGLGDVEVPSIAVDPADGVTAYVGTAGRGLLRGTAAGPQAGQWQPVSAPVKRATAVAAHPGSRGVVVAGGDPASLCISSDRGDSWRELAGLRSFPGRQFWWAPDGNPKVAAVALHPRVPGVIYAGIEMGGVLGTDDGGSSWVELGEVSKDVHALDFQPDNPDMVFASTGEGLYRSENRGAAWKRSDEGIVERCVEAIASHPAESSLMVASASARPIMRRDDVPGAVYLSEDVGRTWNRVLALAGGSVARGALAASRREPGLFYAGTSGGEVFASEDSGENWGRIAAGLPPVLSLAPAEATFTHEGFDFTAVAPRHRRGEKSAGKCPFFT